VKPDLLLLAEDKGARAVVFKQGFDAAYDWTADTTWVSQWSWQTVYEDRKSNTIFNNPAVQKRGELLRKSLNAPVPAGLLLRFLENNDLPRFVKDHTLEQTRLAAALLFALPGIPMLYNGQEIGFRGHPYGTKAIFSREQSIRDSDPQGLFEYYQRLIALRLRHPALRSATLHTIPVSAGQSVVAFHRADAGEHFVIVANLDDQPREVVLDLRNILPKNNGTACDVLEKVSPGYPVRHATLTVSVPAQHTLWLKIE